MALAYIEQVTSNRFEFETKVTQISSRLGIMPGWLMTVMYAESRLNHQAQNTNSSAAGLIQFLSKTLTSLGTSTGQILSMTNVQQLDYVEKYFVMQGLKGKMKSVYDVYLGVFSPKFVGHSDIAVIARSGSDVYNVNKNMDIDKDGILTVKDVKKWLGKYVINGEALPDSNPILYFVLGLLGIFLLFRMLNPIQEDSNDLVYN